MLMADHKINVEEIIDKFKTVRNVRRKLSW